MEKKTSVDLEGELRRRMSRPQRHRLLQGYPMLPLMQPAEGVSPLRTFEFDASRPLLIGVLPHTFCNPKVRGCGFCTFPHEKLVNETMRRTLERVRREIERSSVGARRVEAIYFGGGTANLTPPDELERLIGALTRWDTRESELTLEGVPKYFLLREEALLDVIARAPARQRRVSMGVQTFDPAWLAKMGRDAFGDRDEIASVVSAAHRRGFTASADLLFNLPGAPLALALADVRAAMDIGFDQICVYNLVLTPDLGTEWAADRSLVSAMPDNDRALTTWLAVRQTLLDGGYHQTTLTNFEREPRFVYERASFQPDVYDAAGFGPGAISTFTSRGRALKLVNAASSEDYLQADDPVARVFRYAPIDMLLLRLTRGLARLEVEIEALSFARELEVLERARLIRRTERALALTPEGMFYADAVTGLLAHQRAAQLRAQGDDLAQHMG